jgi:hypothetical protein
MDKVPGYGKPDKPLSDTRKPLTPAQKKSRAEFLKNYKQQHKRTLSLTTGKVVKTEESAKTKKSEWTDKMRGKLNVLLAKQNAGISKVSSLIADVHEMFGKRGYQHGDKQVIAKAVSQQPLDKQRTIAQNTAALLVKIADPLTVTVFNDILDAAAPVLETETHPLLFIPQVPAAKPHPTLATSGPPKVQEPKQHISYLYNPLFGKELRVWHHNGKLATKSFVDALKGGDPDNKVTTFRKLRTIIKEVTDKTNHADVEELDGWIDMALKERSKQEVQTILQSVKTGFDEAGRIYDAVSLRLVRRAELLLKKMEDSEANWNARGAKQTNAVVEALLTGDPKNLKAAFYDPGFGTPEKGKNPRLYDTIKEKIGNNDPAKERASFDSWVGKALRGRSIDDLQTILKSVAANAETEVCPRGGVFQELERALYQNIEERKQAEQFVRTVVTQGDISSAAGTFEKRVRAITGSDSQLTHARMSALIAENLEKLSPDERSRLEEGCADLPAYAGVTALRAALGMSDPKAIENLFVELAAGDPSEAGTKRLRTAYRLAQDQLRFGTSKEIESRIAAALKNLTPQQTIAIAKLHEKLRVGGNLDVLLTTHISAAVSAVVPKYFVEEYLVHGRTPFEALELLEKVVFSVVGLHGNSMERVYADLGHAIRPALLELTAEQLSKLSRLNISQAGTHVAFSFSEKVWERIGELQKELENKYLLPQPLNIPGQN